MRESDWSSDVCSSDLPDQFKAPETVSARHILVLKNKGDSEETLRKKREKAESIRKQLVGGADFAELARTSSDCPSKSNGGNLGSFSRGQMVKPFEEAAFKQKKGEIGPVVQTDFGYHIIQVLDHVPPKTMPLDGDMKTKIAAYLTQQKRYAAFNGLMERLKAKANISIAEKLD
jgi:peptidyl-prolyl cis-trans isomerase C